MPNRGLRNPGVARRENAMAQEVIEPTVEERLFALEREVALLKMRLEQLTSPKGSWLERVSGSVTEEEALDEAMRLAAEILRADQPPPDKP
jgi:hypothetical protein